MSISIYYTATRSTPLRDAELKEIESIIDSFSVDDHEMSWNESAQEYDPSA